jgi:RNA polymerase sigma-70 factor, ECF subfamily
MAFMRIDPLRLGAEDVVLLDPVSRAPPASLPHPNANPARLRRIFDEHFPFVWRTLKRLGVAEGFLPDACQRVFWTVSRRLADIRADGERAFLFGTARRVAADVRRLRQQTGSADLDPDLADVSIPSPEELLDQKRARELLDLLLDAMTIELREVLILQEGEGMTLSEIAAALAIPLGTASSRLRRAREEFRRLLRRRFASKTNARGVL